MLNKSDRMSLEVVKTGYFVNIRNLSVPVHEKMLFFVEMAYRSQPLS